MGGSSSAKEDFGPWGSQQQGAPSLASVARILSEDHKPAIRNVVVLAGAGISTSAGIPDFRSPETGLYANLKKYNLPYPEAIFDIDYFQRKPEAFFTLSKELYPGNFQPTLTHTFFKLLDDKNKLLRVFTQNIDTLERLAGLSADRIVEAHGSFATARCLRCKKEVEPDWMRGKAMAGEVARCAEESCKRKTGGQGSLIKPDIVFFGEGLPERFFRQLGDLRKADLLIIVGTSLQVQPFASLVDRVPDACPRILINLERVGEVASYGGNSSGMRGHMNEDGFDFEGWTLPKSKGKEHIRDVFWEGKCDEGVLELAKHLGWEKELVKLHKDVCDRIMIGQKGDSSYQSDESLHKAKDTANTVADEVAKTSVGKADDKGGDTDEITGRLAGLKVAKEEARSNSHDATSASSKSEGQDVAAPTDKTSGTSDAKP